MVFSQGKVRGPIQFNIFISDGGIGIRCALMNTVVGTKLGGTANMETYQIIIQEDLYNLME